MAWLLPKDRSSIVVEVTVDPRSVKRRGLLTRGLLCKSCWSEGFGATDLISEFRVYRTLGLSVAYGF